MHRDGYAGIADYYQHGPYKLYVRECRSVGRTPEFKVGDKVTKGEPQWIAEAGSVSRLELVGGDDSVLGAVDRLPGPTTAEVAASFARHLNRFAAIDWVGSTQAVADARRRAIGVDPHRIFVYTRGNGPIIGTAGGRRMTA